MASRPARTVMIVVGVLALCLGALWVGQGLGLVPGSFMTGVRTWFWAGLVVGLVGLALLVAAWRRPPGRR